MWTFSKYTCRHTQCVGGYITRQLSFNYFYLNFIKCPPAAALLQKVVHVCVCDLFVFNHTCTCMYVYAFLLHVNIVVYTFSTKHVVCVCVCVHICLHSIICDSYFNIHLISPLPSLHLLKLLFYFLSVFVYYYSSSVCCVYVCTCIDIKLQVSANPSCNMIHTASLILQLCMSLLLPLLSVVIAA